MSTTVETQYKHIVDQDGVPMIAGTTTKVVELITSYLAYGWGAEEMHLQYPYLSLGQIHSALAYYWDHREEIEADIEKRLAKVDALRKSTPPSSFRERLKREGII
jgi:uncharacterized protein (DUF433 family)